MITKQTLLQSLSRFLANCKNIFASKNDTYTKTETNNKLAEKVDKVLMEKTYTNYTASANDQDKGWIYFINVVPTDDNWAAPWSIRYRLFVSTEEIQTQGKYDCTIGTEGTNVIYLCYNEYYSGSYVPISNHLISFYNSSTKYANRETYPIKIGAKIQSARNPTTLARNFKIQIIETIGCTVSFTDTIETYDSYYDANKYGQASQISGSMGLQEVGDVNYANYYNYYYYNGFRLSNANAPLYRYKIVGFDEKMRVIPFNITNQPTATIIEKTPCSLGFTVSNGMAYYGTTPTISSTTVSIGNGTLYRDHTATSSATVAAYNFNTVVGNASNDTLHSNVYWCGSYDPVTDKFFLDTSTSTSWYTVVSNNAVDSTWKQSFVVGKYYWLIGQTCELDGYFAFLANHPLYYFDGDKLVPITVGRKEQTENKLDQSFIERKTNCTQDVNYAKILSLKGNAVVWNQLAQDGNFASDTDWTTARGSKSIANNKLTFTKSEDTGSGAVMQPSCKVAEGHKVYIAATVECSINTTINPAFYAGTDSGFNVPVSANTKTRVSGIATITTNGANGYLRFYLGVLADGATVTLENVIVVDLTLMFGAGNEPSTVAEFEALYPLEYYAYNTGEVLSFCAEKLVTTGINQWDEVWTPGTIAANTGQNYDSSPTTIRSVNYSPCIPGKVYYAAYPFANCYIRIFWYDADKNYLGYNNMTTGAAMSATAPSNAAFFRIAPTGAAYGTTYNHDICINLSNPDINGQYFPYEAPKEVALKPLKVKSHNIWDEEWEQGAVSVSGSPIDDSSRIRPKNFIPVKPNTVYNLFCKNWKTSSIHIIFFANSGDTTSISNTALSVPSSQTFTTPANCHYIKFSFETAVGYGETYRKDICINQSSSFNGNYDPYGVITIHKWGYSAGTARNEIKVSKYIKRIGKVDMGTLNWSKTSGLFYTTGLDGIATGENTIICHKYLNVSARDMSQKTFDKSIFGGKSGYLLSNTWAVWVNDSAYAESSAADFKAAMSGVDLYYELATPIEYDLTESMNYIYHVNKYGTEQWMPANGEEPYTAPCCMDIQYGIYKDDLAEIIVDKKKESLDKVVFLTKSEYDDIDEKDPEKLYVVENIMSSPSFAGLDINRGIVATEGGEALFMNDGESNDYPNSYDDAPSAVTFFSGDTEVTKGPWRMPTKTELENIFSTSRPGSIVNGQRIQWARIHTTIDGETTYYFLVFPDGETINGPVLNPEGLTTEDIIEYLLCGAALFRCSGAYLEADNDWVYGGTIGFYWSSTEGETQFNYYCMSLNGEDGTCGVYEEFQDSMLNVKLVKPALGQNIKTTRLYRGGDLIIDSDIQRQLHIAPTLELRRRNASETAGAVRAISLYHPLLDVEDAELVLLRYSKKSRKKAGDKYLNLSSSIKKGWSIFSGADPVYTPDQSQVLVARKFIFSKKTAMSRLTSYLKDLDETKKQNYDRHFGIALRIPNPEWTWPSTPQRNAIRYGIPESLWSDVLPIRLSRDGSGDNAVYGIGLI